MGSDNEHILLEGLVLDFSSSWQCSLFQIRFNSEKINSPQSRKHSNYDLDTIQQFSPCYVEITRRYDFLSFILSVQQNSWQNDLGQLWTSL